MRALHCWDVDVEEALKIQETLRSKVILEMTSSKVKTVAGGDVAYLERDKLIGAIVVLSLPELKPVDTAAVYGKTSFPYTPGLLSFREGPILIRAYQKLKIRPDVMMFDGQGIAHPRGFGLASHLGLWLNRPSIGCTKTPLIRSPISVGTLKGNFQPIRLGGMEVGVALRTKNHVKPIFVSPGHRMDLKTAVQLALSTCQGFRIPEPIRRAHFVANLTRRVTSRILSPKPFEILL
jgi:deoxyribonuclease V